MNIGQAIREIRKAKNKTLEDISYAAETNTGNLSKIERGIESPSLALLERISKALNVKPSYLHSYAEDDGHVYRIEKTIGYTASEPSAIYSQNEVMIPIMEATASMGNGHHAHEADTVVGGLKLSKKWVDDNLRTASSHVNVKIIHGHGDSMSGTFEDGDMLFVDVGIVDLKIDAVYVYSLYDQLFIKRIQRYPGGGLVAISDNTKYQPYKFSEEDKANIRVLGRVIGAWKWDIF